LAKLVWSTEAAKPGPPVRPDQQTFRMRIEKAGRGGKTVTVADGLLATKDEAATLLSALKKACGGGGAVRESKTPDGTACFALEVQGDHLAKIAELLRGRGFRVKGA
jgi:translation initiation factor 1